MCVHVHYVYVCVLKATGRQFAASQPPTISLPPGRVCVCALVPIFPSMNIHLHTNTHKHVPPVAYACLQPGSAPPLHPTPCPTLPSAGKHLQLRSWPLPGSPLCCIKASLFFSGYQHSALLVICLHHRMHFTARTDSLAMISLVLKVQGTRALIHQH